MMHKQLIDEISRLPIEQRLELLEMIARDVREEMQSSGERGTALSQRLSGVIKFDGEPPTDEELKDMRADYLREKYS
jgi:hypothetical protein